ncbi:DUF2931 family protein [Vibrio hepatarius]|uniref:DUF2931 family protein n=1 Tax=Vibrio hepatarius TaxID=171383 RepID=UPI003736E38E
MIAKKESKVSIKSTLLVTVATLLSACTAQASYAPNSKWRVSVSMPSFYPVFVTQAYGTNKDSEWVSSIHNYTQFFSSSELEDAQDWLPSYDGYGLPLSNFTMMRNRQISAVNELPDDISLYWTSLINNKFYQTKYRLTDDVKKLSSEVVSYKRKDGFIVDSCYRTEFVFGLLPNGQTKVFLKGCGELIYLTELKPEKVMDKDAQGFSAEDYKKRSYLTTIQKRAEEAGATLDPIPWDKVNKVYSNVEVTELN